MSDVRSLLRNERVARRINHPQAQYTSTGVLVCKACQSQIKSDALWPTHLSSSQHINTLKRLAAGLKLQNEVNKGTKRKADDSEEDADKVDTLAMRKRARADDDDAKTGDESVRQVLKDSKELSTVVEHKVPEMPPEKAETPQTINEDEWAAFERDVATPPPERLASANVAAPTDVIISAAPVTAAELAARSREETSVQAKERRQAETEGEKEDAQRRLEEEFDQMEELEERVKRLKDKREALRQQMKRKQETSSRSEQRDDLADDQLASPSEGEGSDFDDDWDDWGM